MAEGQVGFGGQAAYQLFGGVQDLGFRLGGLGSRVQG